MKQLRMFSAYLFRSPAVVFAIAAAMSLLLFQNCGKFELDQALNVASKCVGAGCEDLALAVKCEFNGQPMTEGQSVVAYLESSIEESQTCVSETRICRGGELSGSHRYSSCQFRAKKTCLFDGKNVAHLQAVDAFQSSTVPFGQTCKKEIRTCSDGELSGSYQFPSCEVGAPAACLFDGKMVPHGGSALAYKESSVPYGSECVVEIRSCTNGSLSGSFSYGSCAVAKPKACLHNGMTIPSGSSVISYQNASVPFGESCKAESRVCEDGALSGSYVNATCEVGAPAACMLNGQTIAHGQAKLAYQSSTVPFGSSCVSESRSCNNGQLSGSYTQASCAVAAPAACSFNGQAVADGASVVAFKASTVAFGQQCERQTRACTNGQLSGTYAYASCGVDQAASCLFNGQTIAHGQAVLGYQNSTVPFGAQCALESRVCSNGQLSGTYAYGSCAPAGAAACLFDGKTIASGSSVVAYESSSVAFGQSCKFATRSCVNGSLSGTYQYSSCEVGQPASCLFDGKTIPSGSFVTAYQQSSVPFGQSCTSQPRTCDNGSLSGTYGYSSCAAGQPASCLFNGRTIAHGEAVIAMKAASVAYGSQCEAESRVCSNGTLSGTYANSACDQAAPASCTFNGETIPHGQAKVAYQSATVPLGSQCVGQSRTCTNGSLSGTYTFSSCSVNQN